MVNDVQTPIMVDGEIFKPRILLSNYDFCFEGVLMKNCMSTQFTQGSIYLYISLLNGTSRVNLQYRKGKLRSSYGKANSGVPMKIFGGAIELLNEKMLKYSELTWKKEKQIINRK